MQAGKLDLEGIAIYHPHIGKPVAELGGQIRVYLHGIDQVRPVPPAASVRFPVPGPISSTQSCGCRSAYSGDAL